MLNAISQKINGFAKLHKMLQMFQLLHLSGKAKLSMAFYVRRKFIGRAEWELSVEVGKKRLPKV